MSNAFAIESFLSGMRVDIEQGGASAPSLGAYLHLFRPKPPPENQNQSWIALPDADNPGYFLIQSIQLDTEGQPLVIDIHGVSSADKMKNGALLDGYKPKLTEWHDNQLWRVAMNPATQPNQSSPPQVQLNYVLLESLLQDSNGVPYVMDVKGWKGGQPANGTGLDAFVKKPTNNTGNQLWHVVPAVSGASPQISLAPFYNENNPEATMLSVSGSGFYPAQTLALVMLTRPITQGEPNLAVTDLAGNLVMSAPLLALGNFYGWGCPGIDSRQHFQITVFDNTSGTWSTPLCSTPWWWWTGNGISASPPG
jgi:hypothetical protein